MKQVRRRLARWLAEKIAIGVGAIVFFFYAILDPEGLEEFFDNVESTEQ